MISIVLFLNTFSFGNTKIAGFPYDETFQDKFIHTKKQLILLFFEAEFLGFIEIPVPLLHLANQKF